jgi:hypothetical protein
MKSIPGKLSRSGTLSKYKSYYVPVLLVCYPSTSENYRVQSTNNEHSIPFRVLMDPAPQFFTHPLS